MIEFLRDKSRTIFALLAFVTILPFVCRLIPTNKSIVVKHDELYSPDLYNVNSMDKAVTYIDSTYNSRHLPVFDTAQYVFTVSEFTKDRFYHGVSYYSFSENWIAWLSGKVLWSHLSAIVEPNDILKHSEGLCSQQTIVFMELLKYKNINTRSIGLGYKEGPGHFLCEVHYNNSWRLHDVTMEPQWKKVANIHRSIEYYLTHKDSLYLVYENRLNKTIFDKITEKVVYGNVNTFPANNMRLFHKGTLALTYILPLFFVVMFIVTSSRKEKSEIRITDIESKKSVQEPVNI